MRKDAAAEIKALREAAVMAVMPLEVICGVYPDKPPEGLTEETWRACFDGRDAVRGVIVEQAVK